MPIYEYLCPQEHRFELKQSFSAETIATCPTCSTQAKRLLHVPAVVYKGSGFYTTDYARKGTDSENGSKPDAKGEKKEGAAASSESKSEAKTETKTETKSESKNTPAKEASPAAAK